MSVAKRSSAGSRSPSGKVWNPLTTMTFAPLLAFKDGWELKSPKFLTHFWRLSERNKLGRAGDGLKRLAQIFIRRGSKDAIEKDVQGHKP